MRVALISDLHGNEVALRAVFHDAADQGVDQLVCLGDVATLGPRPKETLALLERAGCRCILGNHDAFMLDRELIHSYSELPVIIGAVDWCREQLDEAELAFIAGFERSIRLTTDDGVELLLFHGTPRSHMEDLLATTPADALDAQLDGERADLMAGGHTHIQMLRQHRGTLIVNPGSVGMPFLEYVSGKEPRLMAHAEYAVIETKRGAVSVDLRRVALDKAELAAAARSASNPFCDWLAGQYS
jgi:putative phosphoesterase